MSESITHLRQYGPVNTERLLAFIAHFGTCDNVDIDADAGETKWAGEKELVNGKEYFSAFIAAAFDHVSTCQVAQSEFNNVIDAAPAVFAPTAATAQEHPVQNIAEQPESSDSPNALDLASAGLEGIVLIACDQRFDLQKVASRIPHMQFSRCAVINTVSLRPGTTSEWGLSVGDEVDFHEITNNRTFVVVGKYAYPANEVMSFMLNNHHDLKADELTEAVASVLDLSQLPEDTRLFCNGQYCDPRKLFSLLTVRNIDSRNYWALNEVKVVQQDVPANATLDFFAVTGNGRYVVFDGEVFDGQQVQEIIEENSASLTCTTYTPPAWATPDSQPAALNARTRPSHRRNTTHAKLGTASPNPHVAQAAQEFGAPLFTRPQHLYLSVMGISANSLTFVAFLCLFGPQFQHNTLSMIVGGFVAALAAVLVTAAVGTLCALVTDALANEVRVETHQRAQQVLWLAGATIGWGFLAVVDMAILL